MSRSPFVLVGLGNPGPAYAGTRHNAGFDLLDRTAHSRGLKWKKPWFRPLLVAPSAGLVCVKPLTFVNRSGSVFPFLQSRYGLDPERLCVVADNMDLPAGEIRMKRRGGHAGHKGLQSVGAILGTESFPRLYVGIGRPPSGADTVEHVLGLFSTDERVSVDAALDRVVPLLARAPEYTIDQLITSVNERRRGSFA